MWRREPVKGNTDLREGGRLKDLLKTGWVLWAALAVVWFGTTHLYPLFEPDEGRYAEIPREMLASGDWVTPRLDGLKYFEKPPLQYWATAALYWALGCSEWTARAWALGLAFLCLPLTFVWVRRFYGPDAAFAALAVLASSPFFVAIGHLNLLDAGFTFWLTAALFAFTLGQAAPYRSRGERGWMLCAWVAAALAVLSKGIVVGVLAGLALSVYSCVQRDLQVWRRLHVTLGLPLFLGVAAPWFIAVSLRNPQFPAFFFLHEHFARFLTTVHERVQPWWYFLAFTAVALLPWLPLLRGAICQAWRRTGGVPGFEPLRFLLIFAAVVLGFFSISQSKLPPYILPLLPPLAVVTGICSAARPQSLLRATWIVAAAVTAITGYLVIDALRRYDATALPLLAWGGAAVTFAILAVCNVRPRHSLPRNALVLAGASMLAWQCLIVAYGAPPAAHSARALVDAARPYIAARSALYSVEQYRQSVPPYLARTMTVVNYTGELEFGLNQEPGRNAMTLEDFKRKWRSCGDAVAFFEPDTWDRMAWEGLPGEVIAADRNSIVVRCR